MNTGGKRSFSSITAGRYCYDGFVITHQRGMAPIDPPYLYVITDDRGYRRGHASSLDAACDIVDTLNLIKDGALESESGSIDIAVNRPKSEETLWD